jgi:hypothetical protein
MNHWTQTIAPKHDAWYAAMNEFNRQAGLLRAERDLRIRIRISHRQLIRERHKPSAFALQQRYLDFIDREYAFCNAKIEALRPIYPR